MTPAFFAKLLALCFLTALFPRGVYSMDAIEYQDDLIKGAAVIAVIDVTEIQYIKRPGEIFGNDGKAHDTLLVVYDAAVVTRIKGEIPDTPFIAQFTSCGDMNLFETGRRLVFLRESGGIYFPNNSGWKITDEKLSWYKQPFRAGDLGPYFEETPLEKAIGEIKRILSEKKELKIR